MSAAAVADFVGFPIEERTAESGSPPAGVLLRAFEPLLSSA